jgi:hypothetical protein
MCHPIDQRSRLRPLVMTEHLGHALLADDRGVLKRRHRFVDHRDDARHVRLRVPGTQGHQGLAARRVQGAHDEVGLPTEPGVDPCRDPRGVRLAEQIDLHGRVDRRHGALGRDERR